MLAKITLTLEQDEQRGTNAAMEETIRLLGTLENLPATKLVLTLECEEMIAPNYRAKLHHGLRKRPIGIIAKIKTTSEEQINIEVVRPSTPMDPVIDDADDESDLFPGQPKSGGEKVLNWLEAREQR